MINLYGIRLKRLCGIARNDRLVMSQKNPYNGGKNVKSCDNDR